MATPMVAPFCIARRRARPSIAESWFLADSVLREPVRTLSVGIAKPRIITISTMTISNSVSVKPSRPCGRRCDSDDVGETDIFTRRSIEGINIVVAGGEVAVGAGGVEERLVVGSNDRLLHVRLGAAFAGRNRERPRLQLGGGRAGST